MWPLVWLFFYFMSAVRFFCTKALLVMFHSERSWPKKNSCYISITRTHDDIQDGLLLCVCVFVCLSVPMPPPHTLSISHPEAFILISRTSSSCHYLFYPEKQTEPRKAERRIASCNAAGEDLCHSVPCRSPFIYLSVFVFSPSTPSPLAVPRLCTRLLLKEIKEASGPRL